MKALKQYIRESASNMYDVGPVRLLSKFGDKIAEAFAKFNSKELYVNVEQVNNAWVKIMCSGYMFKKKNFVKILCDCAEKYADGKIYDIYVAGVPRKDITQWLKSHGYNAENLEDIVRKERFYCIGTGITAEHFKEFLENFKVKNI